MQNLELAKQHFLAGIAQFETQQYEAALAAFEQAAALAPERASVQFNLGTTLFHLGRHDDAIVALNKSLAADAQQAPAWFTLGLCRLALEDWPAASQALQRGLALAPEAANIWLTLAQCQLRQNDVVSALDAMRSATRAAPNDPQPWSELGGLLREIGQYEEAAHCFEQAIQHGADPELHAYYLAAVRPGSPVPAPPKHYAQALFDGYASDFQTHLVEALNYRAHTTLLQPLLEKGRRYPSALDLGCGTGLCAPLLQQICDRIEGVDVSAAMVQQARQSGLYQSVSQDDLLPWLRSRDTPADLIVAADVFIYVGELNEVFAEVARLLSPQGCFAFSVEASEDEGLRLLPSLRYAHSEHYIRELAGRHGLEIKRSYHAPIREEQRQPIAGQYFHLGLSRLNPV